MVNKQVSICDNCGKRTAESKCSLCGNDLCTSCGRHSFDLILRSKDTMSVFGKIVFCKICKDKIKNKYKVEDLFDEDFKNDISKNVGGYLVKKMLVESL